MLRRLLQTAVLCPLLARCTSTDVYVNRHIGPTAEDTLAMLEAVGKSSIHELMNDAVPRSVRSPPMTAYSAYSEKELLSFLRSVGTGNKVLKSMIGQGFYESIVPQVIRRNVLQNPMWYTPYTPYQAEISQGHLEALLNFQTMISSVTKIEMSNASLLDHSTAAAEAMHVAINYHRNKRMTFYVSDKSFLANIALMQTYAAPLNIKLIIGDIHDANLADPQLAGIFVQTPDITGELHDYTTIFAEARANNVLCCCGCDLMASILTKPPGEMGADIVTGTAQRFGLPLGYGGPHAGFMAFRESLKRLVPGRIVGVSKDKAGNPALRTALQTREQHIKRERATSNICTAQALTASTSAFYAIYHGPEGLRQLANEIHDKAKVLSVAMESLGHQRVNTTFFDTLTFVLNPQANSTGFEAMEPMCSTNLSSSAQESKLQSVSSDGELTPELFKQRCVNRGINVYVDELNQKVSISVDEATTDEHLASVLEAAGMASPQLPALGTVAETITIIPHTMNRSSPFLTEAVFNSYKSETEMMRYLQRLQRKDYGLTHGMIPLGSCTMKLNPVSSLQAFLWPEYSFLHPYVPTDQAQGYNNLIVDFKKKMCAITGMAACSIQPLSGAHGEYTGLRCIRAYHESRQEGHRDVCLIPESAHGTNPASAALAGFRVKVVKCLPDGQIDMKHLTQLCDEHGKQLACIMVTYPSTFGLYDPDIMQVTKLVHEHGGQCYVDGANMNGIIGYSSPGHIGADVCHVNLHKTFSVPHGGGGPGMGPICVREHLAPFLPQSVYGPKVGGTRPFGQIASCGYGSASVVTIAYGMMMMLGSHGIKTCSEYAVLNANYMKRRLQDHYPICFLKPNDYCAHEFLLDLRPFKKSAHVESEDVAKRLADYGLHAPTLNFPIIGALLIEPTESESKYELDRFVEAMISIRSEIAAIERGDQPHDNNVLKNAPHTALEVTSDKWNHPYSREQAAYPSRYQRIEKYWPSVGRVDNTYGDLNLMCTCAPLEFYK